MAAPRGTPRSLLPWGCSLKIFVTVGTQLPFDRLIRAVDEWVVGREDVTGFAQLGPGRFLPKHLTYADFIDAGEFRQHVVESSLVIAHAGMGSILTALEIGKPIIVMPRRAAFGEHRNDHQIATARSLESRGRAVVAFDEQELIRLLNAFDATAPSIAAPKEASPTLIDAIRRFIFENELPAAHKDSNTYAHANDKAHDSAAASEHEPLEIAGGEWSSQPSAAVNGSASKNGSHERRQAATNGLHTGASRRNKLLDRLASVVLLDGAVTRRTFSRTIGRSPLELPISDGQTVMDHWIDQIERLRDVLGLPHLRCRVVVGHSAKLPQLRPNQVKAGVTVERDANELRGTGGLLRDLSSGYKRDDALMVMSASQILHPAFFESVSALSDSDADALVLADGDDGPTSCVIVDAGLLRVIPEIGFVDLKEQGLGLMAKKGRVQVAFPAKTIATSIRTPGEYLSALKRLSGNDSSQTATSSFRIIEAGAAVSDSAVLHDAVVLAGGRIDHGSFVASSVVCTGGTVGQGHEVIRQVVTTSGREYFDLEGAA